MAPRGTTIRAVRIDDERWEALRLAAKAEGKDRSAAIRDLIDFRLAISATALRDILDIAFTQLDEADDDEIGAYGFTPERRDELVAHIGRVMRSVR